MPPRRTLNEPYPEIGALEQEGNPVHLDAAQLHKIDLRKLRHAAVLALEGNFSRAAATMHMTKSALSQSIAKLEDDLGLTLFDRNQNGATLSRVGRQLIGRMEKLLFDARGLANDIAEVSAAAAGKVAFGIRPDVARIFLDDLVLELSREIPQAQVKVSIAIDRTLLEYLLHEGVEFVICDQPAHDPNERFSSRRIAATPLHFHVRHGHPLAGRDYVTVAELRHYTIASSLLTDDNLAAVRAALDLAETDAFPGSLWCDDHGYLMRLVMQGDAVLIAPPLAVAQDLAAGRLCTIAPYDLRAPIVYDLYLVTRANRSLAPITANVIERIERLVTEYLPA